MTVITKKETSLMDQAREAAAMPNTLFRIFWLFALAALLGDIVETIFWFITRGQLVSRSSLVFGPFSMVWGLGAVLFTLVLYPLADRSALTLFAAGTLLGGFFEYMCSLVQEKVFGMVFWYYGHLPFNLDSRINLVFCMFWGIAAVIWLRTVHPLLCLFIEIKVKPRARQYTAPLALFLAFSILISVAALTRMDARHQGIPASKPDEIWLDRNFPDQWMYQRYPNMHPPEYYGLSA